MVGQLVRNVPLGQEATDEGGSKHSHKKTKLTPQEGLGGSDLLDPSLLQRAGSYFLDSLLQMKHNGAVEKTRIGSVRSRFLSLRCPHSVGNKCKIFWRCNV